MHYVHGMRSYPPMRTCNVAQVSLHVGISMHMDCYTAGNAEQICFCWRMSVCSICS